MVYVALYWPINCLTVIRMKKLMGEDQGIIIFPRAGNWVMWMALYVCEGVDPSLQGTQGGFVGNPWGKARAYSWITY